MAIEWTDRTSYSKRDKDRTPRSWEWKHHGVIVIVHRHIDYGPDVWLVSCGELGASAIPLDATDVDAAKEEALRFLEERATTFAGILGHR